MYFPPTDVIIAHVTDITKYNIVQIVMIIVPLYFYNQETEF